MIYQTNLEKERMRKSEGNRNNPNSYERRNSQYDSKSKMKYKNLSDKTSPFESFHLKCKSSSLHESFWIRDKITRFFEFIDRLNFGEAETADVWI